MSKNQALAYFVSHGWTVAQAAGIVANLVAESGLNPAAVGDGGLAYGIAQWHPDRQVGFRGLFGRPIQGSSVEDQLAWVDEELRTTERVAGFALKECVTASEAGACVSEKYERPADRVGEAAKRGSLAESIAREYVQQGTITVTLPPSTDGGGNTQPAAPIIDHSVQIPPVFTEHEQPSQVNKPEKKDMGAVLVMGLVQALISQFAPVAKQQITQALDKHGADPVATNAILDAVLAAVATATGSNVNVLKTDNKAAIVAVNTVQNDTAMMAQVEADSLVHLDKMMSVLTKLHDMSVQDRTMDEASMNAAQVRGDSSKFDARPDVAKAILFGSGILVSVELSVMLAFIISGKPVPDLLLGLFITTATWIMAKGSTLVDYAYGTSRSSTDKDVTIANSLAKK